MVIRHFDKDRFEEELRKEISAYSFDETNCGGIGKVFNQGLATATNAALYVVSRMLTEQIERDGLYGLHGRIVRAGMGKEETV
jgi:hypothetical protein